LYAILHLNSTNANTGYNIIKYSIVNSDLSGLGSLEWISMLLKMCQQGRMTLRVRVEITLHFRESRCPCGKTRGGRIASCLTDE